tara:strand:+ start:593 stop:1114 length:522 start_codon:yes stop_codon:yes gene_type:complete
MKNIYNMVCFQIGWWICSIGAKNEQFYLGPIFMLFFIALHIMCISENKWEIILIICGSIFGIVVDTSLIYFNIINYQDTFSNFTLAPLWIIAMWAGFCTTINHSLGWLKGHFILAFLLGAIFGPLSYIAGLQMGIIFFLTVPLHTCLILAIIWGISIPLLFLLNEKLEIISEC